VHVARRGDVIIDEQNRTVEMVLLNGRATPRTRASLRRQNLAVRTIG
jgi:hypothetical protein